jgi:hypothetical protein
MSDVYDPHETERRIRHTLKSAKAALEFYAGVPVYRGDDSSDEDAALAMLYADIERDIEALDRIMAAHTLTPDAGP